MTAVAAAGKGRYVVGTSDGRVLPVEVGFDTAFAAGRRTVTPKVTFGGLPVPSTRTSDGPSCD